jgi:hypothetical protein
VTKIDPVAELAAAVRGDVAEGERLAEEHQVELGPYDEIRHEHVVALLAAIDAMASLPDKAAAFEASAAAKDPASTAALQLNSRARGLRDAIDHITAALASTAGNWHTGPHHEKAARG